MNTTLDTQDTEALVDDHSLPQSQDKTLPELLTQEQRREVEKLLKLMLAGHKPV